MAAGFVVMGAALYAAWFSAPDTLHPAYKHFCLVFKNQCHLIVRIKSFWLTLLAMVCENVCITLIAYGVLINFNLEQLMQLGAVQYGAVVGT